MRSAKRPIQNESSATRRLQMVQNEDCTGNVDKEACMVRSRESSTCGTFAVLEVASYQEAVFLEPCS